MNTAESINGTDTIPAALATGAPARLAQSAASNSRRGRRWMLIVVGLLAGHTAMILGGVAIATHDASFAVTPDYYDRAVHWDQHQAERRASVQLGWHVAVEAAPQAGPLGRRAVGFVLTDAAGRAVPGAAMEVNYFHYAHGQEAAIIDLTPDAKDARRYSAVLPMRYAGTWEFQFKVVAGGKTFVDTQTEWVQ